MSGRDEAIARAIIAAMHARGRDPHDACGTFGTRRCDRCGAADVELLWMISPSGGLVLVDRVCGDLCRCTPTPPCGAGPDGCGAAAGRPCAADCSSRTADPAHDPLDVAHDRGHSEGPR